MAYRLKFFRGYHLFYITWNLGPKPKLRPLKAQSRTQLEISPRHGQSLEGGVSLVEKVVQRQEEARVLTDLQLESGVEIPIGRSPHQRRAVFGPVINGRVAVHVATVQAHLGPCRRGPGETSGKLLAKTGRDQLS